LVLLWFIVFFLVFGNYKDTIFFSHLQIVFANAFYNEQQHTTKDGMLREIQLTRYCLSQIKSP